MRRREASQKFFFLITKISTKFAPVIFILKLDNKKAQCLNNHSNFITKSNFKSINLLSFSSLSTPLPSFPSHFSSLHSLTFFSQEISQYLKYILPLWGHHPSNLTLLSLQYDISVWDSQLISDLWYFIGKFASYCFHRILFCEKTPFLAWKNTKSKTLLSFLSKLGEGHFLMVIWRFCVAVDAGVMFRDTLGKCVCYEENIACVENQTKNKRLIMPLC